ncbi:leucine-rich repeat-containing protein 71-like isoform X2 [Manduca sexta]|uniref:Leucine-rich repeat-containing protein 71 n=1 Tax=Manduca sexta TaxID=7130 RepID=A0A921ZJ90_MANSE|nr:leucine-rich repeat-containing protein 71 isoform X2 [Manduca sexta]XP_037303344.1 leucine-rich repeat-containing protein 71-like isoform X2 [Manduca sexta]KAG6458605.1 hypothetical protein O3G_MSEX010948 [Manduca sexta]
MKPGLSQSMRSIRSAYSTLNYEENRVLNFDEYMVMACKKFACAYPIIIKKDIQDDPYKSSKRSECGKSAKVCIVTQFVNEDLLADLEKGSALTHPSVTMPLNLIHEEMIPIDTLYNNMNQIVEIGIHKVKHVHRIVIQLICLIAPYFQQLAKISITKSNVDVYTIHELSKMLPLSYVTEVCLDQTHLAEANYAILLNTSHLRTLSLSRCLINDEVSKLLASKLHYMASAETGLIALNLSSNHITDLGAKYFADALRTNRHLRYLNLADNRIGDEGAYHILDILMEFPLTYEEIVKKRRRYLEYLKMRRALFYKAYHEWDCKSVDESQASKKSMPKKRRISATSLKNKAITKKDKPTKQSFTDEYAFCKADMLSGEMIGPFLDPFGPKFSKIKDNYTYCTGNMCLSYLNLAYNNLTYQTLKKLHNVVLYQSVNKKMGMQGLIKIVIDGNFMPATSPEIRMINELISKNISAFGSKAQSEYGKRNKGTPRISVLPERNIEK